jgi:methionyl-tRNA formyltransferase
MPADSIISSHRPGLIHRVAERLFVETSDGAIEVIDLQQQGHRRMKSDEFLRGFRFGERAEFE